MSRLYSIKVSELESKIRLDNYLGTYFKEAYPEEFSRSDIQNSIKTGNCCVDGKVVRKSGYFLKGNELVEIEILPNISELKPDINVSFELIHENDSLIVISKPAGLVVHPAPGVKDSTLVHGILAHLNDSVFDENEPERPGIVHRLDKNTSGLMVIAKTAPAKRNLQKQLQVPRTMKRIYRAVCYGSPASKAGVKLGYDDEKNQITGEIKAGLLRDPHNRTRYMVSSDSRSRDSKSHFIVLRADRYFSLIEFTLDTGRTHQIRVHAEYMGSPILGDPVYHRGKCEIPVNLKKVLSPLNRQMLHAKKLEFKDPVTKELLSFESDYPDDFKNVLNLIGFK